MLQADTFLFVLTSRHRGILAHCRGFFFFLLRRPHTYRPHHASSSKRVCLSRTRCSSWDASSARKMLWRLGWFQRWSPQRQRRHSYARRVKNPLLTMLTLTLTKPHAVAVMCRYSIDIAAEGVASSIFLGCSEWGRCAPVVAVHAGFG